MDKKEIKSVIEALLFTWGEPLHIREIEKILDIPKVELKKLLDEMKSEFDYSRRGIQILNTKDSYQLATRLEHYDYLKQLHIERRENKSISNAGIETLTIIAYKQPITKIEIEDIRGVKCDKAIQTLLDRELIREAGRLDKVGKPIIYKTTDEFLRVFGLKSIGQLPTLEDEENLKQQIEEEDDNETSKVYS